MRFGGDVIPVVLASFMCHIVTTCFLSVLHFMFVWVNPHEVVRSQLCLRKSVNQVASDSVGDLRYF
jgi:hypothetical protein